MSLHGLLTTAEIKDLFTEEISRAGGTVSDTFDDGLRLFLRSLLPRVRMLRASDQVQGGVALRADEQDVWVHPYLFRQVCRNGAIMAQAIQTRHIECAEFTSPDDAVGALRLAVQDCCSDDAFTVAAEAMRSARDAEADLAINLMPYLSRLPAEARAEFFRSIIGRFAGQRDRSRFGLMNAVTSVARDTRDPEIRWRLEELGGGIAVSRTPTLQPDEGAMARMMVG